MKYKKGDAVISYSDLSRLDTLATGIVMADQADDTIKVGKDTHYAAFWFPARVETKLKKIVALREAQRKALEQSMGLVYELRNQISCGEV